MALGAIVNFLNYEGWEWGMIACGGTLIMLSVIVFSLPVRRYLIHGLTAGALRGWEPFQGLFRLDIRMWDATV